MGDSSAISFPDSVRGRNRWVLERRGPKPAVDAYRPHDAFWEREPSLTGGGFSDVLTVLLATVECPWRCVMCDLWKFTTTLDATPAGAVTRQLTMALEKAWSHLPAGRGSEGAASAGSSAIKLYNAGSFFDPRAVPVGEYEAIAGLIGSRGFGRVVVECHPALVGQRALDFQRSLRLAAGPGPQCGEQAVRLEVAMGLETAHPEALAKLNKGMTLASFRRAASKLRDYDIDLRVFLLVKPPFLVGDEEAFDWARRSFDLACDCGARVVSFIPTRGGNGAMDTLQQAGLFHPPSWELVKSVFEYGLSQRRAVCLLDLWDVDRFLPCPGCRERRKERLMRMNLTQQLEGDNEHDDKRTGNGCCGGVAGGGVKCEVCGSDNDDL